MQPAVQNAALMLCHEVSLTTLKSTELLYRRLGDAATKKAAFDAVPRVCRTASTLFDFVSYSKAINQVFARILLLHILDSAPPQYCCRRSLVLRPSTRCKIGSNSPKASCAAICGTARCIPLQVDHSRVCVAVASCREGCVGRDARCATPLDVTGTEFRFPF